MPELAMSARCTKCGKMMVGSSIPLLGQDFGAVNGQVKKFLEKLGKHVITEHAEDAAGIQAGAMEYQGMMIMSLYEMHSDDLKLALDASRWNLHQKTLNQRFTDQQITDWVDQVLPDLKTLVQMGDDQTLRRNLTGMLQSMRDRLEEPGKYTFGPSGIPVLASQKAN